MCVCVCVSQRKCVSTLKKEQIWWKSDLRKSFGGRQTEKKEERRNFFNKQREEEKESEKDRKNTSIVFQN